LPETVKMKKDAYSYLPVAFIAMLLLLNAYLFYVNSGFKDTNRKLILENDSLLSVNQKLHQSMLEFNSKQHSLVDGDDK
jgi:hypothetical protein